MTSPLHHAALLALSWLSDHRLAVAIVAIPAGSIVALLVMAARTEDEPAQEATEP